MEKPPFTPVIFRQRKDIIDIMSKLHITDLKSHCVFFLQQNGRHINNTTQNVKALHYGETQREGNYSGVVDLATHLWPRCLRKYPRTLRDCTRMPSLLDAMSL